MSGFVENICRKIYEESKGIITDPDQIKQCYITDDFPKVTVENAEGRKEYRIYMDFDNIAKDIRDRQDNAMAMEFTKCI